MSIEKIILALVMTPFFTNASYCQSADCSGKNKAKNKGNSEYQIINDMETNDLTCPNCGKNSCDASCSSSGGSDTMVAISQEEKRLKSLIPSCNLSETAIVARKEELNDKGLFTKVENVYELPDGYGLIFKSSKETSQEILDYIHFERNCCSNFSFAMEFEPNLGNIHLKIYGTLAIKDQMKNAIKEMGYQR